MSMPFSPCPSTGECTDQSVSMLSKIFGPVIDKLTTGADPDTVDATQSLLGTLFATFNSGVLVVGSLIVSYVAIVGVLNTANDGEAMGKNWSSLWTPVRIVSGGAVLLPTASGYSFIQLFTMMIALWGAGLANSTYTAGVSYGLTSANSIVGNLSESPGTSTGLRDFARRYTAAAYCARTANATYSLSGAAPAVSAANTADRIFVGKGTKEYIFDIKDRNSATNLGGGAPICGTVTVNEYTAQSSTDETEKATEQVHQQVSEAKKVATVQMMSDIDGWVNTWPARVNESTWNQVDSARFNQIVQKAENSVSSKLASVATGSGGSLNTGLNAYVQSLTLDGWASAGGWFQRVGQVRTEISSYFSEVPGTVGVPVLTGLPDSAATAEFEAATSLTVEITRKAEAPDATGKTLESSDIRPDDIASAIPSDPRSASVNISALKADMDSKMSSWVNNVMHTVVDVAIGGDDSDGKVAMLCGSAGAIGGSLNRMKCLGDFFTVSKTAVTAMHELIANSLSGLRVLAGSISSVKGVGSGFDLDKITTPVWEWAKEVVLTPLVHFAKNLDSLAFYFGILLPSLPYTLFMIVVCGWILAVLQTCLAAPLWAIMHMTPDRTFVGSQRQGYLLLMSLFVRPALAVVGLFAGILVSDPLIDYIAKGFFAMRGAIVTSTGLVGAFAEFSTFYWWMVVFAFVLLPVLYMCFGLPQALPDKVLQWIGGGVADLGETHALGQMQAGMAGAHAYGQLPRSGGGRKLERGGAGNGSLPAPGKGPSGSGGGNNGARPMSETGQGVAPRQVEGTVQPRGPQNSSPKPGFGPGGNNNERPATGNSGRAPLQLNHGDQGVTPNETE